MILGRLHGRTRTRPKALNAAAHLMQTFLRRIVETGYIYKTNWYSQSLWYSENGIAHAQFAFLYKNFFFDDAASHAKISLPVLDAFESSSASILSLRLGFLDKSNLLKIPDCPTVDLKKVLSVTKHGFVSEPSARQTLHLRFIMHFRSA